MPSSDANELALQNQELQKQVKKLKKQLTNQVKTGLKEPDPHDDYDQLKEENEELKQQMDQYEQQLDEIVQNQVEQACKDIQEFFDQFV